MQMFMVMHTVHACLAGRLAAAAPFRRLLHSHGGERLRFSSVQHSELRERYTSKGHILLQPAFRGCSCDAVL